jgi:hypothetical protein
LNVDINPLDPQVTEAELVLTPNPKPVEQLATVERIWGRGNHVP